MKTKHIRFILLLVVTTTWNYCLGQISDSTIFPWTYFYANQNTDSTSNPGEGDPSDDLLLESVWLCDELQGGVPYDLIYVNDIINSNEVYKIFVYTERKLIIIDENTKAITGSIDLSDFGSSNHIKSSNYSSDLIRSREKHLAYNQDKHELYCLTQDFKIKIIDPYNEIILGEITPQVYSQSIIWAILKYNDNGQSQQIFLSCTYPFSGQLQSKLIAYSTSDYSEDNIVYIASNADFIKRLDAENNSWLPDIIFPTEFEMCSEIYFKQDGKLFCSVSNSQLSEKPAILVYEVDVSLTNPEVCQVYGIESSGNGFDTHFDYDEENDKVFVSMRDNNNGQGLVMVIFFDYSFFISPHIGLADKIIFNEYSNKLFVKHYHPVGMVLVDWITLIDYDVQPPDVETFEPREGVNVTDIELDPNSNLLYITYDDPSGDVDLFSTEGELIETVHVTNQTGTLKFNTLNNMMYVHVPANYSSDKAEHLWSIEPSSYSTSYLDLQQNEGYWYNPKFYLIDLILDETSNTIYTSNGHGNINTIQCHADRVHLGDDWSWISFPRLDRDPMQNTTVPAETVLNDRIKPGPDNNYTGTMQHLIYNEELQQEEMIDIEKQYTYEPWDPETGELDFVSSNKGYQIFIRDPQEYIELFGDIQDPSVPVELIENFENWAGYYLTFPQHPVNAIPSEIRDNLTWMAGQYWYCFNENPYPDGSGGLWRCSCSQGDVSIDYGDMVKLYSLTTDDFTWQQNNPAGPGINKQAAELFSYEEQANYEAYILELDTNNLPEEIGAMIEDSCIGASQVFPGEDTVLLCAYTEGFEGEEVSFQFAYNTKSAQPEIKEYFVLNTKTGIKEKRRIKAGEKEPYYFISFRNETDNTSPMVKAKLHCYPNPAANEVIVSYVIPTESVVSFQLINIVGMEISSWSRENQSPGNYQLNLNTTQIPSGYYFVRLITDQQLITEKICIVH